MLNEAKAMSAADAEDGAGAHLYVAGAGVAGGAGSEAKENALAVPAEAQELTVSARPTTAKPLSRLEMCGAHS